MMRRSYRADSGLTQSQYRTDSIRAKGSPRDRESSHPDVLRTRSRLWEFSCHRETITRSIFDPVPQFASLTLRFLTLSSPHPYTRSERPRRAVQEPALEVLVNGEARTFGPETTVADLLARLKLQPRLVAVERNEELIPRGRHAECVLQEGDRVEIVTLVGGG
jgi:sulfur carrier protein